MSPTYTQNKKHIYLWQSRNIERSRELKRIAKRKFDLFKKEQKRLFRILLDL